MEMNTNMQLFTSHINELYNFEIDTLFVNAKSSHIVETFTENKNKWS